MLTQHLDRENMALALDAYQDDQGILSNEFTVKSVVHGPVFDPLRGDLLDRVIHLQLQIARAKAGEITRSSDRLHDAKVVLRLYG